MSDMVEKVAAVIEQTYNKECGQIGAKIDPVDARRLALSAIDAMREPAAEATLRRIIREELDNYDRDKGVTPRMSRDGVRSDWPFRLTGS